MSTVLKTIGLIVLTGIVAIPCGCRGKVDKPRFCNLYRHDASLTSAKGLTLTIQDLQGNARTVKTRYPVELHYPLIYHPAPPLQSISGGRLAYLAVDLFVHDLSTDESSILLESDPPEGQIVSYSFSPTGSDVIVIRSWQGNKKLRVYNLNTRREESFLEGNTMVYLTSNCVSPEGEYFFVIQQHQTYSALRVFDLGKRTEVTFTPEITSTKPFSIAWNPWGRDGKLAFSSRDGQGLWRSYVMDIPNSMVTQAGAMGYDSITPCFFGDMIAIVERSQQDSTSQIAFYDGNTPIPLKIFGRDKASFNPMTFNDQHFFLFVKTDGQKYTTMLYKEGMKVPLEVLESADPKPSFCRTRGLLLLAQQSTRSDFFRSEGTYEHPFISSPKVPASLYVLDIGTYSKSKLARDSLYTCWID